MSPDLQRVAYLFFFLPAVLQPCISPCQSRSTDVEFTDCALLTVTQNCDSSENISSLNSRGYFLFVSVVELCMMIFETKFLILATLCTPSLMFKGTLVMRNPCAWFNCGGTEQGTRSCSL